MGSPSATEDDLDVHVRQREVVADLAQRALETDDLNELLHESAAAVAETLEAEYGGVLELLPEGDATLLRAGVGWRNGVVGSATVSADGDSQAGHTLTTEEPVVVDDLREEERFSESDLFADHGVVSGVSALVGSVEDPWGVLGVHTTERRTFTERDADFLRRVANVLASAVEDERSRSGIEEVYGRVSDAFFALDDEWRFTYLNERAHELVNPEGRELVGENVWEEFPEAIGRAFKAEYERAMDEQETVSFEEYYPDPLDSWFEVRAYPSETGLSVYFRDVTDRKERQRELELFRNLVDHSTDSVFVIDLETGRFLDANETSCRRLGYDRDELLDMTVPDVEANLPDLAAWREHAEQVRSEGDVTFEGNHRRADGSTFPVEVNVIHASLDREYLLAIARDVSERQAAQRRLEESERRYRTLVEHFPNGAVALVDGDLRYQTVGGSPLDVADVTVPELEGRPVQEALPTRLAKELVPRYEAALEGEPGSFEMELDGRFYQFRTVPVRADDGEVLAALGMSQDVTEREDRERQLRVRERRLERQKQFTGDVLDAIDDVFYILDEDGELRRWNESLNEVTGYSDGEIVRMDAREFFAEEDRDAVAAAIHEGFETGSTDVEVEMVTKSGDRVPFEFVASTLEDPRGNAVLAGIGRDVSDRKERERALAESERRYRTLAEHFPDGAVGVYDHDLRYTLAAGPQLGEALPSAERLEGERMPEALPDDTVEDLEPLFRAAIEDGETGDTTAEFGDRHWRVWATPLRDADGEISAGLSFAQDVTEQVEREERLRESNERLEQFAYAASHDLQEPLRMVSSYLQLVERRYAEELDEDGEEFIEFAVDGADRMREMIEGLLAYSRVDTRGNPLEPVDLDAVLADVREDLSVKIDERDADVTAGTLPEVRGDRGQLRQVLQNLLDNAIEYGGEGRPRVHVSAERAGRQWTIAVRDEGIGIDSDDVDRVFDVFQRLHAREDHDGTGIGLALCERIVERHGGDIWVESEPGEGSTFYFTLPAVSGDGE